MIRRPFEVALLWMCLFTPLIAVSCAATENPPTVTITIPSTYPYGENVYMTSQSNVDLGGMAGVELIGYMVEHADLSHWQNPQPDQISINITQAAERATINTRNFWEYGCVLASGTFYVNGIGIDYLLGNTIHELQHSINERTPQTGVVAELIFPDALALSSMSYGSAAVVTITNGADILPGGESSVSDNGADAAMQVTNSSGQPITDNLWQSTDGLSFHDSLNNRIEMYEPATSVTSWGPQIEMTNQQIDHVTWYNSTTGESGVCSGTRAWSVSNINLASGDNLLTMTAIDANSLSATDSILITSHPVEPFGITYPTTQPTYSTTSASLDIQGWIIPSTAIVGTAVVSSDFSHASVSVPLDNYVGINIVQAAAKAQRIGCKFFGSEDSLIGVGGTFYVNGAAIDYNPTTTLAQLVDTINSHIPEINVIASIYAGGALILTNKYYGSSSHLVLGNAGDIMGVPYTEAVGCNVEAVVTHSLGMNITDATWNSGSGLVLGDSHGNTIELTEQAATNVHYIANQILLTVDEVTWSNGRTGQSGTCTRSTDWAATGITLLPGENNIQVSSTSPSGQVSTDDLLVAYYEPKSAGAVKQMDNGSFVSLFNMVVTAGNEDTGDDSTAYVEQADKICGMKVIGISVNRGDVLDIEGIMTTSGGERAIDASTGSVKHSTDPNLVEPYTLTPLGMTNKTIGGSANGLQCGVTDAKGQPIIGLNNIGLLVKTWGKVKSTDPETNKFTIDDGSYACVTCVVPAGIDLPSEGNRVIITGISSIDWMPVVPEEDSAIVRPVQLIKARDEEDIKLY